MCPIQIDFVSSVFQHFNLEDSGQTWFKYIKLCGYEEIDTEGFFTVDSDSYTRRHSFKLKKNRDNTVRYISILYYRTVNDWNSLPSSVVLSNSVYCFKSRLSDAWKEPIEIWCRLFLAQLCPNTHFAEARTRRGHTSHWLTWSQQRWTRCVGKIDILKNIDLFSLWSTLTQNVLLLC